MELILFILWYFLPAGIGNIAPILAAKTTVLQKYSYPLDFYKKFRKKRIFGDHKTIRGLIVGVGFGIITAYLQVFIYNHWAFIREISIVDYNNINPFLFGFLASFGALFGDAIKSFFKRQLNIPSGKSWFPADQIDYILGGILATAIYIPLSFKLYILLFIIWFFLHPLFTLIGWLLRLKDEPI